MAAGKLRQTQTARAIVFKDGQLLVMDRKKHGRNYRVLVGGHIEPGETAEDAVIREVLEETSVVVSNPRHVFSEVWKDKGKVHHFFLCDYVSGRPTLHPDSEEYHEMQGGGSDYDPKWLPLERIISQQTDINFVTPRLLEEISAASAHGFPETPKIWTL